jgi:hypothetical protein
MQQLGLSRTGYDKFYTKPEQAAQCCQLVKALISPEDLVIEPSAGNGSFIDPIKKLTKNFLFYDIEPDHPEIIEIDFLNFNPSGYLEKYKKIHTIGNPPFGRQSSLAKRFIKKCASFSDSISFILPKSFKKESFQKAFPLSFHLVQELDLPENSFLVGDEVHNVPCVFQIWMKRDVLRPIAIKEEPRGYRFVKKSESPDISFRRVGVYAGKIDLDTESKSEQSHYFIKFSDPKTLDKLDEFSQIKFCSDNTVGPKSVSKPELIHEFNKIIS